MQIYRVLRNFKGEGRVKRVKVYGSGIAGDENILKKIVKILEVSAESNLASLVIQLAKIKIVLPEGLSFVAYVEEKRYVDIFMYSIPSKTKKIPTTRIIRLDGEKENPELIKHNVIDASASSINCMELSVKGEQGFLGRLEKMKQPFMPY